MSAAPSQGREQRQHVRADLECRLTFRLRGGSVLTQNLPAFTATTRNISEGGLYMELGSRRLLPEESMTAESFVLLRATLEMEIDLEDGEAPIRAEGKAVWIERPVTGKEFRHGVAVQFQHIGETERRRIARRVQGAAAG